MGVLGTIADKGIGELSAGVVVPTQQLHAEQLGIEFDRDVEILHPDHRVHHPERGVGAAHCRPLLFTTIAGDPQSRLLSGHRVV